MLMSTQTCRRVPLLALLLAWVVLRLSQPTLVEFKRDEATIARLGQAIAYEGCLPAVGVDSLGIDNLPLTLYLVCCSTTMVGPTGSGAHDLLNSLALPVGYVVARAGVGRANGIGEHGVVCRNRCGRCMHGRSGPVRCRSSCCFSLPHSCRRSYGESVGRCFRLTALPDYSSRRWRLSCCWQSRSCTAMLSRGALLLAGLSVFALFAPYVVHDGLNGWKKHSRAGGLRYGRRGTGMLGIPLRSWVAAGSRGSQAVPRAIPPSGARPVVDE